LKGRVLVVAGSDSSGGAGIQADIKTITAHGGYAATTVTAITAQDTHGVHGVMRVPPEIIVKQMRLVLDDIGADAIKVGMLSDAETVEAVSDVLDDVMHIPLIVDPVMRAKGGATLMDGAAVEAMRRRLALRATVLTPNIPEAEMLAGCTIDDVVVMEHTAELLLTLGCKSVLLKGGHLAGDEVVDILATGEGLLRFEAPRVKSRHTHGTGCTLASAIAVSMAQGMSLQDSVARGRAYVQRAIATAPGYGGGHGPLNHAHTFERFQP
jgi:hydroxymethylpyrimidine/phosphomethylpyrimidine kinase